MDTYQVEIIKAKNGYNSARVSFFDYTLQKSTSIYLCSKIDPIKEATQWANKVYKESAESFIIYGIGLGYHIGALASLLSENQKIYAIDTNIQVANELKKHLSISGNQNIKLVFSEDLTEIIHIFNNTNNKHQVFEIYTPCMKLIPFKNQKLREIIENYKIRFLNYRESSEELQRNYIHNNSKKYPNVSCFFGSMKNKPIFIISAGPSLDRNIELLKQVGTEAFIFSTGRSLKALVEKGVRVDMFCIIDPLEATMLQIEGLEHLDIPFVFLNTVYYKTVESYRGPKYIGYSMDSDKEQAGWVETGGSVATAILDLAIKFGGNPIIFVGQDLAYTDGLSHCKNARATRAIDDSCMKKVKNTDGVYIPTTSGLLSFRHWIQNKIKKHSNVLFYNCSEGGAFIEGCTHISLSNLLKTMKLKEEE